MKRFLAIFCILMLLPLYCFAAPSPTVGYKRYITISPDLMYIKLDLKSEEWARVLEKLQPIIKENEGYGILDPLKVCFDKQYKQVEWNFDLKIPNINEVFMVLVADKVTKYDVKVTSESTFITDLSDVSYGIYYVIFFVKGA